MARAGRASGLERSQPGGETASRLVRAAIESLQHEGFTGASARAIASRAGCNQALVFYHFGRVTNLLLAALDETSRQRRDRYLPAIESASSLSELVSHAEAIFTEDIASGHMAVLAEMIAGASSVPGLAGEVSLRLEPWVDLVETAVARVLAQTPFAQLMPAREAAYAVVALYLGIEMLSHLDSDQQMAESFFAALRPLSEFLGMLSSSRE